MSAWVIYISGAVLCVLAGWGIKFFLWAVFGHRSSRISAWIGILERLLIYLVIVLTGQYGIVGWVLGAKAVARFARAEDPNQSAIYFVGTLLSLLLALAIAAAAVNLLPRG